MTLKMEVEFGTYNYTKIELDLDDYGEINLDANRLTTHKHEREKIAYDLLRETMNDITFMCDGHRNDDAVNSLIALHSMGYDAEQWMQNFLNDAEINKLFLLRDINKFKKHVERVVPYLSSWGPASYESHAMDFAIPY